MTTNHLRATLLKIQDRLSNDDRKRLHFFLANEVPRTIRDDQSLGGTLNLLESLFDQAKIGEENFHLLIHAFTQIRCREAVSILKAHKESLQPNWTNKSNITSTTPQLNDIVKDQEEEQEDKTSIEALITKNIGYDNNNNNNNNNNVNRKAITINVGNEQKEVSIFEDIQPFYITFKMNKYLFCTIGLILMIIGILLSIFIWKHPLSGNSQNKMKENPNIETSNTDNNKLEFMTNDASEKVQQKSSEEQNTKKYNTITVKPGKVFGNSNAFDFNDSSLFNYSTTHYLCGLDIRGENGFEIYRFYYDSSIYNQRPIPSEFHGNEHLEFKVPFHFATNDKIKRVQGRLVNKTIDSDRNFTKLIITGLEFTSEDDVTSPMYRETLGEMFTEEYDGYTLGYATGKSREYIEQIQFFWYKSETNVDN